jgi:hypothetical protein
MALFDELDAIFTNHSHYYVVALSNMNDALEMCARVTHANPQVVNYGGQIILATQHSLGEGISWLTEIPRPTEEQI